MRFRMSFQIPFLYVFRHVIQRPFTAQAYLRRRRPIIIRREFFSVLVNSSYNLWNCGKSIQVYHLSFTLYFFSQTSLLWKVCVRKLFDNQADASLTPWKTTTSSCGGIFSLLSLCCEGPTCMYAFTSMKSGLPRRTNSAYLSGKIMLTSLIMVRRIQVLCFFSAR